MVSNHTVEMHGRASLRTITGLSALLLLSCFTTFATTTTENKTPFNFDLAQLIRSIALIYTDDKLDPEVEEFLNYKQEIIWEDNAYVYLWGMDKVTDDPYATGKEILEKLLEEDKVYDYEKHPYNSSFMDKYDYIEKPEHDLICSKVDFKCSNQNLMFSKDLKSLVDENNLLIERYKIFTNLKHFKMVSSMNYDSPWPSYTTITISQKLFHLSLISEPSRITNDVVVGKLSVELNSLKYKLKEADNLISKMIIVAMISENIELFNILNQKRFIYLDEYHTKTIFKSLSSSELSSYSAFFYEHFIGLKMVFDMSVDIERLNGKQFKYPTLQLLKIIAFIGIKPNLTANTQYRNVIKKLFDFTNLSQREFYLQYNTVKIEARHDPIRNFYAKKLIGDVSMDFKSMYLEYQARVFDLDMKLQLLRLIIQSESIDNLKTGKEFLSSYDQTKPYIKDGKICYSGLIERNEEYRCLLILNK